MNFNLDSESKRMLLQTPMAIEFTVTGADICVSVSLKRDTD